MTVAELIEELRALPNQGAPVRVVVDVSGPEDLGPDTMWADVVDVKHEGPFVALRYD